MTTTTETMTTKTIGIRSLRPGDRVHAFFAKGRGRSRVVYCDVTGTVVDQVRRGVYDSIRNDADGQIVRITCDCRLTRLP